MTSLKTDSATLTLALVTGLSLFGCAGPGEAVSLGNNGAGQAGQTEPGGAGQAGQAGQAGSEAGTAGSQGGGSTEQGGSAQGGEQPQAGTSALGGSSAGTAGAESIGGTASAGTASGGTGAGGAASGGAASGGEPAQGGVSSGGTGTGGVSQGGSGGQPSQCQLVPSEIALCEVPLTVYYFDSELGFCQIYVGCPEADAFFSTLSACEATCGGPSLCALPEQAGDCDGALQRYYFDTSVQDCIPFTYGGCGGNANNFESREACETACVRDPCQAPPQAKSCNLTVMSCYFDAASGTCQPYPSGTCGVGANSFSSQATCEETCTAGCVIGVNADLPCCSQGTPMWSTELAADPSLMAYPFFGFPTECELVDCWLGLPVSRVVQPVAGSTDPPTCEFTDECSSVDDCVKVINHGDCCACARPSPKAIVGTQPCVVPEGEQPGPACILPDCQQSCPACPDTELMCNQDGEYGVCTSQVI